MKLLTKEIMTKIPPLYSTQDQEDPIVQVKFFDPTSSWTWYVIEGEPAEEVGYDFWGLVDGFEQELGYFTLHELEHAKDGMVGLRGLPIERDLHWEPRPLSKVREEIHR